MTDHNADVSVMEDELLEPTGQRNEGDSADKDDMCAVPTDQGWAWMVCAGCFVITFIMAMYDHVLAVMFVDVVEMFDVSVTTATAVFTILAFTFSIGSVLSTNIIAPKFGDRKVIVCAAVINSASTVIIAFSPNITFYLIFHSLKGFSIGSMWIPALGLLGHYFKRRRSLATSLTNTGVAVSLLATPPLARHLIDRFDIQGALLIISWIEMQAIAAAMLLRSPFVRHARKTMASPDSFIPTADSKKEARLLIDKTELSSPDVPLAMDLYCELSPSKPGHFNAPTDCEYTASSYTRTSMITDNMSDLPAQKQEQNSVYEKNSDELQVVSVASDKVNSGQEKVSLLLDVKDLNNSEKVACHKRKKLHCCKEEAVGGQCRARDRPSVEKEKAHWFSPLWILSKVFDVKLLGDWLMIILLASTALGALLLYIPTYIPTLAVKKDVAKSSAAMLLTICGGVSLVSSVLQGLIIDFKIITASRFIAVSQIIVGTMCHLTHFFTSFPTLVFLSVTQGMFGGARISLMPVLAMDYIGVRNLGKALGYNAMVGTLSLSLHHPFLGYLVEKTNGFAVPFHYVGIALYISSGLMLLEPIGRYLNSRRERSH